MKKKSIYACSTDYVQHANPEFQGGREASKIVNVKEGQERREDTGAENIPVTSIYKKYRVPSSDFLIFFIYLDFTMRKNMQKAFCFLVDPIAPNGTAALFYIYYSNIY